MDEKHSQEVYEELQSLLARMPKWRQGFLDFGLKPSEFFLLHILERREIDGETTRLSDLAEEMGVTPAAVTNLVTSLERAGYLRREPFPGDRRVVLVSLTETGKSLLAETQKKRSQLMIELVNWLGEKDAAELVRIVRRVQDFFVNKLKEV